MGKDVKTQYSQNTWGFRPDLFQTWGGLFKHDVAKLEKCDCTVQQKSFSEMPVQSNKDSSRHDLNIQYKKIWIQLYSNVALTEVAEQVLQTHSTKNILIAYKSFFYLD